MASPSTRRVRKGSPATTRLRLLECSECGCKVRLARVWLLRAYELGRRPSCPVCGVEASCPDAVDAVLYDDHAAEAMRDYIWDDKRNGFALDSTGRDATWEFQTRSENSSKAAKGRHRCEYVGPSGQRCGSFPSKGDRCCKRHQEMPF